jgi:hypothetical protein
MEPRALFPQMPDEVFDLWLRPEIERNGWPFSGEETVVADPAWAKYLRNHSPAFWRGVVWNRVLQNIEWIPIEQRAKNVANQLAGFTRQFSETGFAPPTLVPNSVEKVIALAAVTNTSGKIPKPLIFLIQGGEWWLMDGHHRLAALFTLENYENFQIDAWVGTNAI